jgi:CheY-like chemotaxis protein
MVRMRSVPSYRATTPALILLVDDNQDGVLARKCVLQELGYQIATAASAEEALTLVKVHPFNLIITDFKMAHMDGAALIASLRKDGYDVPVILLSGFVDKLGFTEAATGASMVIQKSANEVAHLVRAVKRLLAPARKPASSQRSSGPLTRNAKAGD